MPRILTLFLLLTAPLVLFSCNDKKRLTKEDRKKADLYFDEEAVEDLSELKNQMAEAPTDFLRLFKDDPIPWQTWNHSVPRKAESCQAPILAVVVSSRDGGCRDTIKRIMANPKLLSSFKDNNVCTLIDIHAHPEIGLLSYLLSSEIRKAVGFPMLIWMSHEAHPIAWLPVSDLETKNLISVINNSSAMVDDIWNESSDYAVKNSRRDNKARQDRLNSNLKSAEEATQRIKLFKRQARQTASLYDPISRNLDDSGGLVPSGALELLGITHLSPALSKDTRARARDAIQGVVASIREGAIQDPLDDLFFFARRSVDWSHPAFSKELEAQAQFASVLIKSGLIINDQSMVDQGVTLVKKLESDWLSHNYTNESSLLEKNIPGVFLWDWPTLKKILSPEEQELAEAAFALKKNGNIPAISDPISQFYELNNLHTARSLAQISTALSSTPEAIKPRLNAVISKLREHREETGAIFRETQITAQTRAQLCLSQIAVWTATGSSFDLAAAVVTGNIIRNEHHPEGKQLTRFPSSFKVNARGSDYATAMKAGVALYQATLDEEWLAWSSQLAAEALDILSGEESDSLIQENSQKDQIIPISIYNYSMIFSDSTIGVFDQAITRIATLCDDSNLQKTRVGIAKSLTRSSERLPFIHSDFLISCAMGDQPLVAILSGSQKTPKYQSLLLQLNRPEFSSFVVIRSDKKDESLKKLPSLSKTNGLTLLRGSEIIGRAQTIPQFRQILLRELSRKE